MKHLRYSFYMADVLGEQRHPQEVMKAYGLSYIKAVPQTLADSWMFLGVTGDTSELPAQFINKDDYDFSFMRGRELNEAEWEALTKEYV